MKKLNEQELENVKGGFGFWSGMAFVAGITFLSGVISGYVNPKKCAK